MKSFQNPYLFPTEKNALKPQKENIFSIDIITVTCNDQKWFPAYLQSLINQKGINHKNINLVVVDNNSREENFKVLLDCYEKGNKFLGEFRILRQNKNLGFAKACNVGAKTLKGDFVFLLNIDTELEENALKNFFENFYSDEKVFGAWEFRQFPYEHPKIYNPLTGEISWGSGAALLIKRDLFEKLNGFDTNFYMYTDDVDISWRIRLEGFKIRYLPECIVYHYSYQSFNEIKPLQYYYSIFNNLQLRVKFGTLREIRKGIRLIGSIFKRKGPFEHSRKKLLKIFLRDGYKLILQRAWYLKNKSNIRLLHPHKFIEFDYEQRRLGDFFFNELPKSSPVVSVIVRTINRPHILKETLVSIQKQTYKNIEVVIIEDGKNLSEDFIKKEFTDLKIKYFATGKKEGRTRAGNLGLEMSSGTFLAFLDDDDLLYADHFETLIRQSERNPLYKVFHNFAFEAKTRTISKMPYRYSFESLNTLFDKRFNIIRLSSHNFLPIQTVMFHREVYETLGGFDETLDMLEDWDLWIKYASKYEFYTVFKTCSIYKVPAEKDLASDRTRKLDNAYHHVRKSQLNYIIQTNPIKLSELHKNINK